MTNAVMTQLSLFAYSFVFGIIIGILYTGLSITHILFDVNGIVLFIEDIAYFFIAAVSFFIFCFIFTFGDVRLYVLFSSVIGWITEYSTLGRVMRKVCRKRKVK